MKAGFAHQQDRRRIDAMLGTEGVERWDFSRISWIIFEVVGPGGRTKT